MGMSDVYAAPDEEAGYRTIRAAMDSGVNFLNTGDFYGNGRNELLIARAIKGRRDQIVLSVKAGALKSPDGRYIGFDMRPQAMKNWVAHSLSRLGTDYIDLYQPSRVDPQVPIEETIGALADLVKEGWIRFIGLSEAGPDSIRRAHAVHPIAAHEAEYSLMGRDIERNVLPVCRELGIATVAYSVLAGGLLGGHIRPETLEKDSLRSHQPRFQAGNLEHNLLLVEALNQVAREVGTTSASLAIAWVLAQGEDFIPLIGARTIERLAESLPSARVALTPAQLATVERAIPADSVRGTQYEGFIQDMIRRERSQRGNKANR
jgi:aryl-alcohol dehydrogenase-like predicted oxidoreductase